MKCAHFWAAAGSLAGLLLASGALGQEWTRFRGPNGSGLSPAALPVRWTERDYNWKVPLAGLGHSSPVLWRERIFLTSGDEETGKRLVFCLDAADGRQLWSRESAGVHHPKHQLNSFASATPVVDRDHVYVSWATPQEFTVLALDHQGRQVWQTDLGPFEASHGFGASPIVYHDLVIVPNGQEGESFLAALDRRSGAIRWKAPCESEVAYSTPCVYQRDGQPDEIVFTNWKSGIAALDPRTGRTNWAIDVFDKGHVEAAIGSPVVAGELVLGVCGWLGQRQEVIAVRPDRAGRQARKVYQIDRAAPLVSTPLVVGELLFLWSDQGIVSCAEAATGEIFWRRRVGGTYYGSPVCAGDHLYCISADGEVVVLAASNKYELLARNPLGEPSHSTPAIAAGAMYLRTFSQLISIGGKRAEPAR